MSDYIQRSIDVSERAAKLGFDWPDAPAALLKVSEEVAELSDAIETDVGIDEELGDLWFALVNVTRKLGLDPQKVVESATEKFSQRFSYVEAKLAESPGVDLEVMESWWEEAKALSV